MSSITVTHVLLYIPTQLHRTKLKCAPNQLDKLRRDNSRKVLRTNSGPENKKSLRTNEKKIIYGGIRCINASALMKCLCEKQGKWLRKVGEKKSFHPACVWQGGLILRKKTHSSLSMRRLLSLM